jgi:hypothetical protein
MYFKYLLIAYAKEVFPDERWGTYGSHSDLLKETYRLENSECLYKDLGAFICKHPDCEYDIYMIREPEHWTYDGGLYRDESLDEKIEDLKKKAIDYSQQLKEEAKVKAKQKELQIKLENEKRIKQEELKKLAELRAKYEK